MVWLKIPGLVATKTVGSVPKVSRENIHFWSPERRLDMSPGVLFNKCWFCHHKLVRRWPDWLSYMACDKLGFAVCRNNNCNPYYFLATGIVNYDAGKMANIQGTRTV